MKTNNGRSKGRFTERLGQCSPSPKSCPLNREDSVGKGSTVQRCRVEEKWNRDISGLPKCQAKKGDVREKTRSKARKQSVATHEWITSSWLGYGEKTLHLSPQGASHLVEIKSASANSIFLVWSCGNAWVKGSVMAEEAVYIVITNQSWKICLGLKPSGHFLTVQPWSNYLISLCCNFPTKIEGNDNNLTSSQSFHDA